MRRRGFTVVELLIVVSIIALLSAIMLPLLSSTRGRAQLAAMKSDLRNLVTVEEGFFAESSRYTTTPPGYALSAGNTNLSIIVMPGRGWNASITDASGANRCAVFVGSASLAPATKEGTPGCGPGPGRTAAAP